MMTPKHFDFSQIHDELKFQEFHMCVSHPSHALCNVFFVSLPRQQKKRVENIGTISTRIAILKNTHRNYC